MTASGLPAARTRFAISGDPSAFKSCEPFFECPLPDRDEIAESMEDVLGGARPISARCAGVAAAMVGRVPVEKPPGGLEFRTGSDTLRVASFVSLTGRAYLGLSSGIDSTDEVSDV